MVLQQEQPTGPQQQSVGLQLQQTGQPLSLQVGVHGETGLPQMSQLQQAGLQQLGQQPQRVLHHQVMDQRGLSSRAKVGQNL